MKNLWKNIAAISVLCVLVSVFFIRLFYPEPALIVTPDYGRSDAWHFSFPTKFALYQSLQTFSLPLWRNDIGSGFPLFAEGQTGALYLPNLILFSFLPPVPAYNTALTLAVMTLGIGVYMLCKILLLSRLASIFAAISIMFSGLTMTQLTHITLLQGISLLPVVTSLSILVARHPTKRYLGLLAFTLSQQIYAGFPQATFLTLILSGLIVFWLALKENHWQIYGIWILGILLGLGAGAIQLLPSFEFLKAGTDPQGFSPSTATMYSMPFTHLLSFFDPYYFGNPALGTYPPFYAFDGSIFWENTAYLGILPILLLISSILLIKKHSSLLFWWGIMIMSITLAAGKYGPTYILFSIWPLTLFRVPSRFLWLSIIAIVYIASYVITVVQQKKSWHTTIRLLIVILITAHSTQLLRTWWSYQLIMPAHTWLTPPPTTPFVTQGRILTIGETRLYNDAMTKTGWTTPDIYHSLRMGLSPDSNILWGISQYHIYAGRFLNRPTITQTLLSESINIDKNIATISATNLLSLFSVDHIISFIPLDTNNMHLEQIIHDNAIQASIYDNPLALPRAYITHVATSAATLTEAVSILRATDTSPGERVLLEDHSLRQYPRFSQFLTSTKYTPLNTQAITWKQNAHEQIQLEVTLDVDSILVLTDTYYPGWKATVDATEVPIIPANLSQRAILVPKGTHTITFTYAPLSIFYGKIISGIFLIVIVFLMIAPMPSVISRIQKTISQPSSHRQNIHRMS